MNERELIKKAIGNTMPDLEFVRRKCVEQGEPVPRHKHNGGYLLKNIAALAACAVFAVAAAYTVPRLNGLNTAEPDTTLVSQESGITPAVKQQTGTNADSPGTTIKNTSKSSIESSDIIVSDLVSLPKAVKGDICLKVDDFIKMNKQELCYFYETNVFPTVLPNELLEMPDAVYGVFKRDKGAGEVYYSQNFIKYSSPHSDKTLSIVVSKGQLPHTDIVSVTNKSGNEKSRINGNKVFIGHCTSNGIGFYYSEFVYCNVGFRITAEKFSKTEFINTLKSIIK